MARTVQLLGMTRTVLLNNNIVLLRLKSGQLIANQIWEFCYSYDYCTNSNSKNKFCISFVSFSTCRFANLGELRSWCFEHQLVSELIKARGLCIVCGFFMGCRSYAIGQWECGNMKNKNKLVKWKGLIDSRGECRFERKFLL